MPRRSGHLLRCLLFGVPLCACSLVTTPIKVAGSVVEHTIDAVSPFDDAGDAPSAKDAEGATEGERSLDDHPAVYCAACGTRFEASANFCSGCGEAR